MPHNLRGKERKIWIGKGRWAKRLIAFFCKVAGAE